MIPAQKEQSLEIAGIKDDLVVTQPSQWLHVTELFGIPHTLLGPEDDLGRATVLVTPTEVPSFGTLEQHAKDLEEMYRESSQEYFNAHGLELVPWIGSKKIQANLLRVCSKGFGK